MNQMSVVHLCSLIHCPCVCIQYVCVCVFVVLIWWDFGCQLLISLLPLCLSSLVVHANFISSATPADSGRCRAAPHSCSFLHTWPKCHREAESHMVRKFKGETGSWSEIAGITPQFPSLTWYVAAAERSFRMCLGLSYCSLIAGRTQLDISWEIEI